MGQKGAFILGQVYNKQMTLTHPVAVSTSTSETGFYNSWNASALVGFGWVFAGLSGPATNVTNIQRIDFSNDLVGSNTRGNVSAPRSTASSLDNSVYGWLAGGNASGPPTYSTVDRTDYNNDLIISAVRGPLTATRYASGGVTNGTSFGWVAGGFSPTLSSTVDRIDFGNDLVTAYSRTLLTVAKQITDGVSNGIYGWFAGGFTPTVTSTIDRIDFSADTTTALSRGPLSLARGGVTGVTNRSYGWFAGGTSPTFVSNIDRTDFSNDTIAAIARSNVAVAKNLMEGGINPGYAWFIGGQTATPAITTALDRLDLSTDTGVIATRGTLITAKAAGGSGSNLSKPIGSFVTINSDTFGGFGWIGGASLAGGTAPIIRIDFSNDSVAATTRKASAISIGKAAGTNNANYGWLLGGESPSVLSIVYRIDYSNDANDFLNRGLLGVATTRSAGFGNSNYGYASSGGAPQNTYIQRIEYANDSGSLLRSNSVQAAWGTAGLSNQFFGWQIGQGSYTSRLDFSNDIIAATIRSNASGGTYMSGVGTRNYGYFTYGFSSPTNTSISRIDYSNDTATTPTQTTSLLAGRHSLSATGNSVYGYFTGGYLAPTTYSSVERIVFSSDTAALSARGTMPTARYGHTAVSNYVKDLQQPTTGGAFSNVGTFGWLAGGQQNWSIVERIDYSNDAATASVRGSLATARVFAGMNKSAYYAWIVGANGGTTLIDRINFANDSTAAITRGVIVNGRNKVATMSTAYYGWMLLGQLIPAGTTTTTVERLDFGNDLATTVLRGNGIFSTGNALVGVNNATYGWVNNPTGAGTLTTAARIEFSNDMTTMAARSAMTSSYYGGSISTQNYGYHVVGTPVTSQILRLDFSNDLAGAVARSFLSVARTYTQGASGNNTYGWWAGGYNVPTVYSLIDRTDFANDTVNASARGPQSIQKYGSAGGSNSVANLVPPNIASYNKGSTTVGTGVGTYGWVIAGSNPATPAIFSSVERINFSNDLVTPSTRNPLSGTNYLHSSIANANYSWTAGGFFGGFPNKSNVLRIDYSADLGSSLARGPLSSARYSQAKGQLGTANYGWVAMGRLSGPLLSSVERIDYSTDTLTSRIRGPMIRSNQSAGTTSNNIFGWTGGGTIYFPAAPSMSDTSYVERISFSNDTGIALSRAIFAAGGVTNGAVGNLNYGWHTVGTGDTLRIDYSNDSTTSPSRGLHLSGKGDTGTAGNAEYGWYTGGTFSLTFVGRVTFSSDTIVATRSSLSIGRYSHAATSNYTK